MTVLTPVKCAALSVLANGIIPADETDNGAATVDAGQRLAQKIEAGINAKIYLSGLECAESTSRAMFGSDVSALRPEQVHELLHAVRDKLPGFFKQLRLDVCSLYLSDPGVWQRIGFPGPASEQGGYADFDRPQHRDV